MIAIKSQTILGLDMAKVTGWAVSVCGRIVGCGAWDLGWYRDRAVENGHNGHLFCALREHVTELILDYGVRLIAFEVAHQRGGPATKIGVGTNAVALMLAADYDLPTLGVHSLSLKKWVTGSGKAGKDAMIAKACEWLREDGFQLEDGGIDDNTADAVCVVKYAAAQKETA